MSTETTATLAVNVALAAPAATVADAGTVTLELLLDSPAVAPPAGARPLSVIVQLERPAPVNKVGEQARPVGWTGLRMLIELPVAVVAMSVPAREELIESDT